MTADRPLFRVHASVAVMHEGRVLLVQEAKPSNYGRWNLPGGHVDHGETIPQAAARELREESGLDLPLAGLIGAYSGPTSVRFVFRTDLKEKAPIAGHEILAIRWFTWDEVLTTNQDMVAPDMLRTIAHDATTKSIVTLALFASDIFAHQKAVTR